MAYLLDANVFIQAKNLHYGFDFCPVFWDWLVMQNKFKIVFSVEKVLHELQAGDDSLADWATQRGKDFFLPPDEKVLSSFSVVSKWVLMQNYTIAAINTFFQIADYYLIAHAMSYKSTVVTHEVPSNSVRKVKIPDVFIGLGINFINPFDMLRKEKARFVLAR